MTSNQSNSKKPKIKPRYPIYIPSKGRSDCCLTAQTLQADGVSFSLVVQPQDEADYRKQFPNVPILVLPFTDSKQGLIRARNWIKEHSIAAGYERHWQLDDNIRKFYRRYKTLRIYCNANIALAVCEDFTDQFENVGLSGLNYSMFAPDRAKMPAFRKNVHVYSCTLVNNAIPFKWRLRYNDDTDLCLQVLANGMCTILLNAFLADKIKTMVLKGGNTSDLYQGDGRLRMARDLERMWPGIVSVNRRFGRPQHVIKNNWRDFTTALIRKPKTKSRKYAIRLTKVSEIQSPELRDLFEKVL